MKKAALLILYLSSLCTTVYSQYPEHHYPRVVNAGFFYEKFTSKNKRIHSYNFDISREKKKFSYGIGIGTISVEHTSGYYMDGKSVLELIDKLVIDTSYYLPTGEFIYEMYTIEVYDSVRKMFAVPFYSRYRYLKFPLFFAYEIYKHKRISLDIRINSTFIVKYNEKITSELPADRDITNYKDVRKNFYYLTGIGALLEYKIYECVHNSFIKRKTIIKNLAIFISPIIYYAPNNFYADKKIYYGISTGIKLKIYYYNPEAF